jgi:catechol 2,3-dioxygenase-like lactoylglutathione lyase family enzyme
MKPKAVFDQVNIVSGDPAASVAFYRRLGLEIPESHVWRTATGIHHVTAQPTDGTDEAALDIDSTGFAQRWNAGWSGRADLGGRVVLSFGLPTREAVDETYADLTDAGYGDCRHPSTHSGVRATPSLRTPTASPWAS